MIDIIASKMFYLVLVIAGTLTVFSFMRLLWAIMATVKLEIDSLPSNYQVLVSSLLFAIGLVMLYAVFH